MNGSSRVLQPERLRRGKADVSKQCKSTNQSSRQGLLLSYVTAIFLSITIRYDPYESKLIQLRLS